MKLAACALVFGVAGVLAGCGDSPSGGSKKAAPPPKPLTLDQVERNGAQLYGLHCKACHADKGQGVPGIFPPLAGSARLASPQHFVNGLLFGFPPVGEPGTSPWMGEMPKFSQLKDEDIAKLATYVRQTWGNATDEITPGQVALERTNR
ncbi:c-type cytochrome [Cerasicoccus maritimus]|uniref:c-type cytochrome n=1 Tax=Cerasicoccus maritimus TaxID=490089 RepID=UPI002852BDFB|nr:cytochrome c [Cerasicoccus maritimus]